MERVKGQWDRLADWRVNIYSTILKVFGYTAIRHGFFQSDPHPGNWLWDRTAKVLTLIDWGGVEDWRQDPVLKQAHCNLANLYSTMGTLSERWNACDAVVFNSPQLGEMNGIYLRSGVSIYVAKEGESG